MLAPDRQALQNLLLSLCTKAAWDELSTSDAQAVVDDILHTTRTILADACHLRNQSMSTCLPPEVMTSCFSFLPLKGCVTVSHVSRTWRAIALDTPSLWNDLNCYIGDDPLSPELVQMALSRSGVLPIQLEYIGRLDDYAANHIQSYLNRIASLKLYNYSTLSFLNHPAPLLHTLALFNDVSVSEDFLGRSPGRLATLRTDRLFLPASCPALSNLTALIAWATQDTTLSGVFAMCPRLQILSLQYLTRESVSAPGCCPQSLSDLSLSTGDRDCDLVAVYQAYKGSKTLQDISIDCNIVGHAEDFSRALPGAVDVVVKLLGSGLICIIALFADGRRLGISWPLDDAYSDAAGRAYPPFFAQAAPCFDQLRAVRLPLGVLPFFILDAPPLPALEELRVDAILGKNHLGPPADLEWSELAALRNFVATRSEFRVFLIVTSLHKPSASVDDAHSLLARLASCATHLAVTVAGFTADAIPDDLPRELNVIFDLDL